MNADDIDILTRTLYGEARGEPTQGKIAVAHVILNRVKANSWYGNTVKDVCLKPSQFSCWNPNDPNLPKIKAVTLDDAMFQHCMYAALAAGLGYVSDMTSGSCHYHSTKVRPKWAKNKQPVCQIGGHLFFNDIS